MAFDSSSFAVHHNSMLESGDELRASTQKIRATLDDLETAVRDFNTSSSGLSIEAFNAAKVQWDQGAAEMNAALEIGTRNLQQIHDEYIQADNQSAQNFYG